MYCCVRCNNVIFLKLPSPCCVGRVEPPGTHHQMVGDASNSSIDTLLAAWYFKELIGTILRTLLILRSTTTEVIQNHYHIVLEKKKNNEKKEDKRTAHHWPTLHAAATAAARTIVVTLKKHLPEGLCRKIWTCSFLARTLKLALLHPNSTATVLVFL